MKKKVIAAGHICLDITPVFPGKSTASLGDILSPGKLVNVGQADVHTGGSVANTGLAMKFFGADVSLMGKIGGTLRMPLTEMEEENARKLEKAMKEYGILS